MSLRPGWDFDNSQAILADLDRLLESRVGLQIRGVLLDINTVDANSPLGTTHLRRGLVLGRITATELYKEFDNAAIDGSEISANAVILAENVDVDGLVDPIQAASVFAGTVNQNFVFGDFAGLTQADVQRISFVDSE